MIIKVCGLREPENISAVASLDIDLMGFVFWEGSVRCVKSIPVHSGLIPDKADKGIKDSLKNRQIGRVGVFVDEMPQVIMTHAYNYSLDYIQLHGNESAVYMENLKRTLVPDILPDVKMIKALSIREADDVKRWQEYEGIADMLLFDNKCTAHGGSGEKFDWSVLDSYDGNIPFLLSGGIGVDDADDILAIRHPQFAGIDLNSRFECKPAVKDIEKLKCFIKKIRNNEQDK
jgi:phosphoribosylanthranilate isomerase